MSSPSQDPVGSSLKGSLILADPSLREPTFFQSVLLLTEHSSESGAFGYILNRPLGRGVGDLIGGSVLPPDQRERLAEVPVFMGGPVSTEYLTFSALGWSDADATLQYTTHLSAAEAVLYGMEGFQIQAFIGYAGWSEGQLEDELRQKTWIPHRPEKCIIEVANVDQLWKMLLRELSPWHKIVADEPENLWLN